MLIGVLVVPSPNYYDDVYAKCCKIGVCPSNVKDACAFHYWVIAGLCDEDLSRIPYVEISPTRRLYQWSDITRKCKK